MTRAVRAEAGSGDSGPGIEPDDFGALEDRVVGVATEIAGPQPGIPAQPRAEARPFVELAFGDLGPREHELDIEIERRPDVEA